jgi:hypothetical protein
MRKLHIVFLLFLIVLLNSCSTLKKSERIAFSDGFYKQKTENKKQLVYVDIEPDTFRVYTAGADKDSPLADTIPKKVYPSQTKGRKNEETAFIKNTLDIDFLTIPIKLRRKQNDVKAQLNANINGAVYLGYRTDKYVASYTADPLNKSLLDVSHYGFSVGIFTGIGNTALTPTTTNGMISQEYDGIAWSKGIAGIFAINNFTAGVAIGLDNLLDGNNDKWIYEGKPWLGLALGLNLN